MIFFRERAKSRAISRNDTTTVVERLGSERREIPFPTNRRRRTGRSAVARSAKARLVPWWCAPLLTILRYVDPADESHPRVPSPPPAGRPARSERRARGPLRSRPNSTGSPASCARARAREEERERSDEARRCFVLSAHLIGNSWLQSHRLVVAPSSARTSICTYTYEYTRRVRNAPRACWHTYPRDR